MEDRDRLKVLDNLVFEVDKIFLYFLACYFLYFFY